MRPTRHAPSVEEGDVRSSFIAAPRLRAQVSSVSSETQSGGRPQACVHSIVPWTLVGPAGTRRSIARGVYMRVANQTAPSPQTHPVAEPLTALTCSPHSHFHVEIMTQSLGFVYAPSWRRPSQPVVPNFLSCQRPCCPISVLCKSLLVPHPIGCLMVSRVPAGFCDEYMREHPL
jgi:hypothetical protein